MCKTQLAFEMASGPLSPASDSRFMWHKRLSQWTSNDLGNDATTEIWSWSALSVVSTVWKQIVTGKVGEIFFPKKQELIALKQSSFWKIFTVYCF